MAFIKHVDYFGQNCRNIRGHSLIFILRSGCDRARKSYVLLLETQWTYFDDTHKSKSKLTSRNIRDHTHRTWYYNGILDKGNQWIIMKKVTVVNKRRRKDTLGFFLFSLSSVLFSIKLVFFSLLFLGHWTWIQKSYIWAPRYWIWRNSGNFFWNHLVFKCCERAGETSKE